MKTLPRISDVLSAKARVNNLHVASSHNLSAWTWGASYVRLVELNPCGHAIIPEMLAAALWNDPSVPEYAPEEWLPNVSFRAADRTTIGELVSHAVSDIDQSDAAGDLLSYRLRSMDISDASAIFELVGQPGGSRPSTPRQRGPTYQVMWQSKGTFVFLEVHNES